MNSFFMSALFDSNWYCAVYPDVAASHLDPFLHYLAYGAQEGRNPNPFFDTLWYLETYQDVAASGINPLFHYEQTGWKEGRDPGPVFSSRFYRQYYLSGQPDINPLAHYLHNSVKPTWTKPSALFDATWYCATYSDVASSVLNPFWHYLTYGAQEGRNPNPVFNTLWYLATYTDVAASGINPLLHYEQTGWKEGRDPGPDFSTRFYRQYYLSAQQDINPLAHYLHNTETSTLTKTSALFNAAWYCATYPDVATSDSDPFWHYLTYGAQEGRNPNPLFNTLWYLATYPDVAASGMNPLIHYEQVGWKEGRDPGPWLSTRVYQQYYLSDQPDINPLGHYLQSINTLNPTWTRSSVLFDAVWYRATYPEVASCGLDPFWHYLVHGAQEGRNPNPFFDTLWYLETYEDVAASGMNPLIHYETIGSFAGYDPSENFSTEYYASRYASNLQSEELPLHHYMQCGRKQRYRPLPRKRILIVSRHCPTRAHAGGLRILDIYQIIKNSDKDIYIELFTQKNLDIDWDYEFLDEIFHKVYETSNYDLRVEKFWELRHRVCTFDVIDLEFIDEPQTVAGYKEFASRLLFTPMESVSRNYAISKKLQELSQEEANAQKNVKNEVDICRIVDDVICVSEPDANFLRKNFNLTNVKSIETGVSNIEFDLKPMNYEIKDESTVLFVAYFGSQTNVEALEWYLENVHQIVKEAVPQYKFKVVGRGDLEKFIKSADSNTEIVGEVPKVCGHISQATVGIAPALSGSGFRGKINQYAMLRLPTVASPIAADGLAYRDGEDIFVCSEPKDFAGAIIKLLKDKKLQNLIGENAKNICLKFYSWLLRKDELLKTFNLLYQFEEILPRVNVILPSYRHARYLQQRIESIVFQTYKKIKLVVIDDCSQDGSDDIIRKLQQEYHFEYIKRKKNSGTPFSAWEYAAKHFDKGLVWICESDDFAEVTLLETAVDFFLKNKNLTIFYCNSWIVDENGARVGSTVTYFLNFWKDGRWNKEYINDGCNELSCYQRRGMIIPNMSSAVISCRAFKKEYQNNLKRYKLTGDWLFVGKLLKKGLVAFSPKHLNNFRCHCETARNNIDSVREQAEFLLTKFQLFNNSKGKKKNFIQVIKSDIERFRSRADTFGSILKMMWKISRRQTLRFLVCSGVLCNFKCKEEK